MHSIPPTPDFGLTWYPNSPSLLFLAACVLSASGLALLTLIEFILAATGMARQFWQAITALTVGIGVWAGCFIGVLSLQLPVPFTLSPAVQLTIVAVDVFTAYGAVLSIDMMRRRPWFRWATGLAVTLGVAVMHLLSFFSVRLNGTLSLRPGALALWLLLVTVVANLGLLCLRECSHLPSRVNRLLFLISLGPLGLSLQTSLFALSRLTPAPADGAPLSLTTPALAAVPLAVAALGILLVTSLVVTREQRTAAFINAMAEQATDIVFLISRRYRLLYANPPARALLGDSADNAATRLVGDVMPAELWSLICGPLERVAASAKGELHEACYPPTGAWYQVIIQPWPDAFSITLRDISLRKALAQQLLHQSLHDPLTGLANRTLLRERVEAALADPRHQQFAVLFLDLDDFKLINDSYGHTRGDEVLMALARRLSDCVRPCDTISRLGGDEFAILLRSVDQREAITMAERMIAALSVPVLADGMEIAVRSSIGIAMATPGSTDGTDVLLRNADMAMYDAKAHGKARVRVYDTSLYTAVRSRLELSRELRRAIETSALVLHYQPVIALKTGEILYLEALVRWDHPERGLIGPLEFIPLAEETGLIVPLGEWVIREACRQTRLWQERLPGAADLAVGVNLAPAELEQSGLIETIVDALNASGLAPRHLVLEVTESSLLRNTEATLHRLKTLHSLGLSLAIDDFGTGYSALSYLRHFPFDIVKLDKSFVTGGSEGERDKALLHGVLELARGLKLEVVAEGVEHPDQAGMLADLGCRFGQGYCFARPLSPDAVTALLTEIRSR